MYVGDHWAKITVIAGIHSCRQLQGRISFLTFSAFRVCLLPLLLISFPTFKVSHMVSLNLFLSDSDLLNPSYSDSSDYIDPTKIIQNNLSI